MFGFLSEPSSLWKILRDPGERAACLEADAAVAAMALHASACAHQQLLLPGALESLPVHVESLRSWRMGAGVLCCSQALLDALARGKDASLREDSLWFASAYLLHLAAMAVMPLESRSPSAGVVAAADRACALSAAHLRPIHRMLQAIFTEPPASFGGCTDRFPAHTADPIDGRLLGIVLLKHSQEGGHGGGGGGGGSVVSLPQSYSCSPEPPAQIQGIPAPVRDQWELAWRSLHSILGPDCGGIPETAADALVMLAHCRLSSQVATVAKQMMCSPPTTSNNLAASALAAVMCGNSIGSEAAIDPEPVETATGEEAAIQVSKRRGMQTS